MVVDQIVEKFKKNPSYVTNGAGRLSRLWNCTKDEIKEAKEVYRNSLQNKPVHGMKLKSRWQNAAGEWLESYKADENSEDVLNDFKEDLLDSLKNIGPEYNLKDVPNRKHWRTKMDNRNLVEIALPDYHFGKIDTFTLEQQGVRFYNAGFQLYEKVLSQTVVDHVLIPIGNDFFNSEAVGTTTKGTRQDNNATFYEMFRMGVVAVKQLVSAILEKTPNVQVTMIVVPGNHDSVATVMLGEVLNAYFDKDIRVNVDVGTSEYKYFNYGSNLFMYNHGDKVKHNELPLRMAIEVPHLFAKSRYRFIKLGHYHKMMHDEIQGVEVTYMPSLSSADKWHNDNNFLSHPKASAVIYNYDLGKASTHNLYIEHVL